MNNRSLKFHGSNMYDPWVILGIILRRHLNWVDHVNYTAQKEWKALHFVMRVLKKGKRKTKIQPNVICTSYS